ncbi:lytic murein transglycosylase [Rhodovulum sp. PH10]|uniref:lytic murein transglycosylase n=1 Tax=Rhodovulum sp. PH10 TaxID=1187851 RepID=UPI0012F8ABDE|nr:lytic murein transglycosylase [Rhodovulum sp. PH10]
MRGTTKRRRTAATGNGGRRPLARAVLLAVLVLGTTAAGASAQACRNTGSFDAWRKDFLKEAADQGVSQKAIGAALPYLAYSQRIVNIDRGQRFFAQSFLQFSDKLLMPYRLTRGPQLIAEYRDVFARAEKEFGVPAPVITAFWGLESDFGANMGDDKALTSLATLAYDCRRSDMFRGHLIDALRMIERGDLTAAGMVGSWAGELGQTQMMPSEYFKNAVDYDGDGKRDLLRSVPDVIGSSANYLAHLGWRRGEPWLEEVRVPDDLAWADADLAITRPVSEWARRGVTARDGKPLGTGPNAALPASLLLPMGRKGPAFLAYPNFQAYLKWNASLVYSTTAAYYATRLAGAPPMNRGDRNIPVLGADDTKELQQRLNAAGFDAGEPDGKLGAGTRTAVRAAQQKFGLPADSWPTPELLAKLRRAR